MFDGKVKGIRPVSLVGKNPKADAKSAKDLVENARKQREARATDRLRNGSVIKLQKVLRSKVTRIRWHRQLRTLFDHSMLTGTDVQSALVALPMFFNARIDQNRLAAANNVIANMLNHPNAEGNSVFRCQGLLLERPLSEGDNNALRRVVACISLSIQLLAEAHTNTQLVAVDVLSEVVLFLDGVLLSESIPALLRTVLAMLLANKTAQSYRSCTSGTSTTAASSTAPASAALWKRCRSLLRQLLDMAVNWINKAQLSQTLAPQQRAILLPYRQKAIVFMATHVLTQGASIDADRQLLSVSAPEDWLFVFQHYCNTTSSPAHSTATTPLTAVETLNLLANFAQMFLASRTQQLSQLFNFCTPVGTGVDASLRELGRLFLQLASHVLGSGDRGDSASDSAARQAAELESNTATVGAMFGLVTTIKPANAPPSAPSTGSSTLPVHWIAQEMVFPSVPTPSSGQLFGASSGDEDSAMAQTEEPHSSGVHGDYQQASGWKKLEYRIGGVLSGIIAEQRRQYSAQRSSVLAGGQSLEILVKYLTSREVVGALMSNVTVASSGAADCMSPTKSCGSAMSVAESATTVTSDDMDVVKSESTISTSTSSANKTATNRTSGAIIEMYSQLLMVYPSEFVFESPTATAAAQSGLTPHSKASLLINLAFADPANPLSRRLWSLIQAQYGSLLEALVACGDSNVHRTPAFTEACRQANISEPEGTVTPSVLYQRLLSALHLFCVVFLQQLAAVDDEELLEQQKFFTLQEIRALTYFLKLWLLKLYWTDPLFDINSDFLHIAPDSCTTEKLLLMHCQLAATRLFNHFCIRNERRAFLQAEDWSWASVSGFDLALDTAHADETVGTSLLLKNAKVKAVLTFIPQVIPFKQRVSVLHGHLDIDREQYYSVVGHMNATLGMGEGVVRVQVRRDHLVEDAFNALHAVDTKLKGRIKVEFISEQGLNEAGIDGGGLFKEFIDSLGKAAFNPAFGLFIPTSQQQLTPNPASAMVGANHLKYFHFIGKILGKAVYERLLLESEFSAGLLNFLLDRKNSLDDLHFLDEQLHRSLMQLKHHANAGGDIESLELYFESTRSSFGHTVTAELMPGGSNVKVTRANVHAYIHQLANHKQNVEGSEQCRALRAGFQTMIPLEWVRMFSPQELQLLLSGDRRSIDIVDMKRHTNYSGGFAENQPYIQAFWQIVEEMGAEDQGHLLRFVTSCSRQPLLGFGQLNPSFAIQQTSAYASQYQGGSGVPEPGEAPRLPSAATCMNLLKLPLYDSVQTLKEKLLYAIRSNSGFELS